MNVIVKDSIVNAKTELILLPMTITGAITSVGIQDVFEKYPEVADTYQSDISKIINNVNGGYAQVVDSAWLGKHSIVSLQASGFKQDVVILYCRDTFSGRIDIGALETALSDIRFKHFKHASLEISAGYGDGRIILDTVDKMLADCQVDAWVK